MEGDGGSGDPLDGVDDWGPSADSPRPREPGTWGEGAGKNLEVSVAQGASGPFTKTAPSGAWGRAPLPASRDPRCRRRGAAQAVVAGQLPPSKSPASAAAFAPGGGPARREPGPLPASERTPRARCWRRQRQRRRRGWRACRCLLAQRRRPGQALLGTLKNFPGARLAADSRESLGCAPPPPKPESAEPRRAHSFLPKPRQGRGEGKPGERAASTRGPCSGFGKGRQRCWWAWARTVPASLSRPQCRDCTCRRPPSSFLGGKR